MVSERPIRRKICSHANNFESLIALRNTYVWVVMLDHAEFLRLSNVRLLTRESIDSVIQPY